MPGKGPLLSVVMPAYNAADTIARAIESVLGQTYRNIEAVVVNDGSKDATAEVVQRQYPQVTYVEQENAGPCVARTEGVRAASGELVGFLDADDEWAREKAERQVTVLQGHPEIDILGTSGWRLAGSVRYLAHKPDPRGLWQSSVADIFSPRHPMANSIVLRRQVFLDVGGYDLEQDFYEDLDLLCRMMYAGHTLYCLDEPLYIHHRQASSRSSRDKTRAILDGRLRTLGKLDPSNYPEDHPGLLTRRTHSLLTARQLAEAALLAMRADDSHERPRQIVSRLDELPTVPAGLRMLSRVSRRHWPTFARLFPRYQRMVYLRGLISSWGTIGALLRQRLMNRAAAELRANQS